MTNGTMDTGTDVLVIGAGMSGMAAAADLADGGLRVRVVDKGRGVGGRMATRRIGEAVLDHGAQFVTARGERFQELLGAWEDDGVAEVWCRGFADQADGHPRWRGRDGMKVLPRQFGNGVEVGLRTRVRAVVREGDGWRVNMEEGGAMRCGAVVLTAPVPQSLELMDAGGVVVEAGLRGALEGIGYERCLAVMAVLDGPSGMRPPGGMAFDSGPVTWLADNQMKGISPVPCVTVHGSHEFSLAHWDGDREAAGRLLLEAVSHEVGAGVVEMQVHGWKFSKPARVFEEACAVVCGSPPLVLAGDAFAGPKVEGAARSGWAAAEFLLERGRGRG